MSTNKPLDQTSLSGISNGNLNSVKTCSTQTSHSTTPSSFGLQFDPSISTSGDPIGTMLVMPMNFDWVSLKFGALGRLLVT